MRVRSIAGWILVVAVGCTSASDGSSGSRGTTTPAAVDAPSGDGGRDRSQGGPGSTGSGGSSPERASTTVDERAGDATSSGDVEGYPELAGANVTGSERAVDFDLVFAREVPERTPHNAQMILSLSILDQQGDRYVFNATGTEEGWSTVVLTPEGRAGFRGEFAIAGRTVGISVPWSELGGPRPFRWIVSAAWTGDPSKGTSYAFDSIPNRGFAGFPDA
ncbi:MAG: hypothetical protein ACRDLB_06520 [Actinomycetota bacterium]